MIPYFFAGGNQMQVLDLINASPLPVQALIDLFNNDVKTKNVDLYLIFLKYSFL